MKRQTNIIFLGLFLTTALQAFEYTDTVSLQHKASSKFLSAQSNDWNANTETDQYCIRLSASSGASTWLGLWTIMQGSSNYSNGTTPGALAANSVVTLRNKQTGAFVSTANGLATATFNGRPASENDLTVEAIDAQTCVLTATIAGKKSALTVDASSGQILFADVSQVADFKTKDAFIFTIAYGQDSGQRDWANRFGTYATKAATLPSLGLFAYSSTGLSSVSATNDANGNPLIYAVCNRLIGVFDSTRTFKSISNKTNSDTQASASTLAAGSPKKLLALDTFAFTPFSDNPGATRLLSIDTTGGEATKWTDKVLSAKSLACNDKVTVWVTADNQLWFKSDDATSPSEAKAVSMAGGLLPLQVAVGRDGTIWFCATDGSVHKLDPGALVYGAGGKQVVGAPATGALAVKVVVEGTKDDNTLLVIYADGKIVSSTNGGTPSQIQVPVPVKDAFILQDGTVGFVVTDGINNNLYCGNVVGIGDATKLAKYNAAVTAAAAAALKTPITDVGYLGSGTGAKIWSVAIDGSISVVDSLVTNPDGSKKDNRASTNYVRFEPVGTNVYRIYLGGKRLTYNLAPATGQKPVLLKDSLLPTDVDEFFVYGADTGLFIRYLDLFLSLDTTGLGFKAGTNATWEFRHDGTDRGTAALAVLAQMDSDARAAQLKIQAAADQVALEAMAVKQKLIKEKLDSKKAELQAAMTALTSKTTDLQASIDAANAAKNEAQKRIDQAMADQQAQQAKIDSKIAELRTEFNNANTTQDRKDAIQKQIAALQGTSDDFVNILFNNAKQIAAQNAQAIALATKKAELERQLSSITVESNAQVKMIQNAFGGNISNMLLAISAGLMEKAGRALAGVSTDDIFSKISGSIKTQGDLASAVGKTSPQINTSLLSVYSADQVIDQVVDLCYTKLAANTGVDKASLTSKVSPGLDTSALTDWAGLATLLGSTADSLKSAAKSGYGVSDDAPALEKLLKDVKALTVTDNKTTESVINAAKADKLANVTTAMQAIFGSGASDAVSQITTLASFDPVNLLVADVTVAKNLKSKTVKDVVDSFKADLTKFSTAIGKDFGDVVQALTGVSVSTSGTGTSASQATASATAGFSAVARLAGKTMVELAPIIDANFATTAALFGTAWAQNQSLLARVINYDLTQELLASKIASLTAERDRVKADLDKEVNGIPKSHEVPAGNSDCNNQNLQDHYDGNMQLRAKLRKFMDERAVAQKEIDDKVIEIRNKLLNATTAFDMQGYIEQIAALKSANDEVVKKIQEAELRILQKKTEIMTQSTQIEILTEKTEEVENNVAQFLLKNTREVASAGRQLDLVVSEYDSQIRRATIAKGIKSVLDAARIDQKPKNYKTQETYNAVKSILKSILLQEQLTSLVTASQSGDVSSTLSTLTASALTITANDLKAKFNTTPEAYDLLLKELGTDEVSARLQSIASALNDWADSIETSLSLKMSYQDIFAAAKVFLSGTEADAKSQTIDDKKKAIDNGLSSTYVDAAYGKLKDSLLKILSDTEPNVSKIQPNSVVDLSYRINRAAERFLADTLDWNVIFATEQKLIDFGNARIQNLYSKIKALFGTYTSDKDRFSTNLSTLLSSEINQQLIFFESLEGKVALFKTDAASFNDTFTQNSKDWLAWFKDLTTKETLSKVTIDSIESNVSIIQICLLTNELARAVSAGVSSSASGLDKKKSDLATLYNWLGATKRSYLDKITSSIADYASAVEKVKGLLQVQINTLNKNKESLGLANDAAIAKNAMEKTMTPEQLTAMNNLYSRNLASLDSQIRLLNQSLAQFDPSLSVYQAEQSSREKRLMQEINDANQAQIQQLRADMVNASAEQAAKNQAEIDRIKASNQSTLNSLEQQNTQSVQNAKDANKAILDKMDEQINTNNKLLDDTKKGFEDEVSKRLAQVDQLKLDIETQKRQKELFLKWKDTIMSVFNAKIASLPAISSNLSVALGAMPDQIDSIVDTKINSFKNSLPQLAPLFTKIFDVSLLGVDPNMSIREEVILANKVDDINKFFSTNNASVMVFGVPTDHENDFAYVERNFSDFLVQKDANIFDSVRFLIKRRGAGSISVHTTDSSYALTLDKIQSVRLGKSVVQSSFAPADTTTFTLLQATDQSGQPMVDSGKPVYVNNSLVKVKSKAFPDIVLSLKVALNFADKNNLEAASYFITCQDTKTLTINSDLGFMCLQAKKLSDDQYYFYFSTKDGVQPLEVSAPESTFIAAPSRVTKNSDGSEKIDQTQLITIEPGSKAGLYRLKIGSKYLNSSGQATIAFTALSAKIVPSDSAVTEFSFFKSPMVDFVQEFEILKKAFLLDDDFQKKSPAEKQAATTKLKNFLKSNKDKFLAFKQSIQAGRDQITDLEDDFRVEFKECLTDKHLSEIQALLDKTNGDVDKAIFGSDMTAFVNDLNSIRAFINSKRSDDKSAIVNKIADAKKALSAAGSDAEKTKVKSDIEAIKTSIDKFAFSDADKTRQKALLDSSKSNLDSGDKMAALSSMDSVIAFFDSTRSDDKSQVIAAIDALKVNLGLLSSDSDKASLASKITAVQSLIKSISGLTDQEKAAQNSKLDSIAASTASSGIVDLVDPVVNRSFVSQIQGFGQPDSKAADGSAISFDNSALVNAVSSSITPLLTSLSLEDSLKTFISDLSKYSKRAVSTSFLNALKDLKSIFDGLGSKVPSQDDKTKIVNLLNTAKTAIDQELVSDVVLQLAALLASLKKQLAISSSIIKENNLAIESKRIAYLQNMILQNGQVAELEAQSIREKYEWAMNVYLIIQKTLDANDRDEMDYNEELKNLQAAYDDNQKKLKSQRDATVADLQKTLSDQQAAAKEAINKLTENQAAQKAAFESQQATMKANYDRLTSDEKKAADARIADATNSFNLAQKALDAQKSQKLDLIQQQTDKIKQLGQAEIAMLNQRILNAKQYKISFNLADGTEIVPAFADPETKKLSYFHALADNRVEVVDSLTSQKGVKSPYTRFDQGSRFVVRAKDGGSFAIETADGTKRLTVQTSGNKKTVSLESFAKGSNPGPNQTFFLEGSDEDGVVIRDLNKTGFLTVLKTKLDPAVSTSATVPLLSFTTMAEQLGSKDSSAKETQFVILKTNIPGSKLVTIAALLKPFIESTKLADSSIAIDKASSYFKSSNIAETSWQIEQFVGAVSEFGQDRIYKKLMSEAAVKKSNDLLKEINDAYMYTVSSSGDIVVDKDSVTMLDENYVEPLNIVDGQTLVLLKDGQFVTNKADAKQSVIVGDGGMYQRGNCWRVSLQTDGSVVLYVYNKSKKLSFDGTVLKLVDGQLPMDETNKLSLSGTRQYATLTTLSGTSLGIVSAADSDVKTVGKVDSPDQFKVGVFNQDSIESYMLENGLDRYDDSPESQSAINGLCDHVSSMMADGHYTDEQKTAVLQSLTSYLQINLSDKSLPVWATAINKVVASAKKSMKQIDKAVLEALVNSSKGFDVADGTILSISPKAFGKYLSLDSSGKVSIKQTSGLDKSCLFKVFKFGEAYSIAGFASGSGLLTMTGNDVSFSTAAAVAPNGKLAVVPTQNQQFYIVGNLTNLVFKSATLKLDDENGYVSCDSSAKLTISNSADSKNKFAAAVIDPGSITFALVSGDRSQITSKILTAMIGVKEAKNLDQAAKGARVGSMIGELASVIFDRQVSPALAKGQAPRIQYYLKKEYEDLRNILTDEAKNIYSVSDMLNLIKSYVLFDKVTKVGIKISDDAEKIFEAIVQSFSPEGQSEVSINDAVVEKLSNFGRAEGDASEDLLGKGLDKIANDSGAKIDPKVYTQVLYGYTLQLCRTIFTSAYQDNTNMFAPNDQGQIIDQKTKTIFSLDVDGRYKDISGKVINFTLPVFVNGVDTGATQSWAPGIIVSFDSSKNGIFKFAAEKPVLKADSRLNDQYKSILFNALIKLINGNSQVMSKVTNAKEIFGKIMANSVMPTFAQISQKLATDIKSQQTLNQAQKADLIATLYTISARMPMESMDWIKAVASDLYEINGQKASWSKNDDGSYTVSLTSLPKTLYAETDIKDLLNKMTEKLSAPLSTEGQMTIGQKYEQLMTQVIDLWVEGNRDDALTILRKFKDDSNPRDWDASLNKYVSRKNIPGDGTDKAKALNAKDRSAVWSEKNGKYLIRLLTEDQQKRRIRLMGYVIRTPALPKVKVAAVAATPASTVKTATPTAKTQATNVTTTGQVAVPTSKSVSTTVVAAKA